MIIDIETISRNIYIAASDLDAGDYIETRETDLENITSAISKIRSYSDYNRDFETLAAALETIFNN